MSELVETEQVVTDPSISLWYENPVEWLKGLRYDLKNTILPKAIKIDDPNKNEILDKLVSEIAMGIWKITFTHSSVDPNGTGNYETPEKMGDTAMKTSYDSAVIQKFPGISEHLLTLLNNLYMSKPIQRQKSEELGLYKWLRTILPVNISIHEDLLEALFGSLYKIGDRVLGQGNGGVLCSNLVVEIYDIEAIDLDKARSHPKTQFKEIIEIMRWHDGKNIKFSDVEVTKQINNQWEFTVILPDAAIEYIKNMGYSVRDDKAVAIVTNRDKKVASDIAYQSAIKFLADNYKITRGWALEQVNKEYNETLFKNANTRMIQDNYKRIDFHKHNIDRKKYVQLVGEMQNELLEILITVMNDKNMKLNDMIAKAASIYGIHGKQPIQNIIYITEE